MDEKELHAKLEEKVSACWSAYVEKLLKLSPSELISQADEISAASFCCDQLTSSPGIYPADLLEHLLRFDDPLETMREQWMDEQSLDYSDDFEHALWSLREYGLEPGETSQELTM